MGMGISKADQLVVNEFVDAAKCGDLARVRELLPQLNGKDEAGDTALHAAALKGHVDVVNELLAQGSALENDVRDSDDTTPLMLAAGQGHFEIVHKLIRSGASPNIFDRMGWSPLHHAASGGHSLVLSFLIDKSKRSTMLQKDSSGCSLLWLGAHSGDPETVRLLLLQGLDPDEINDEGVSIFDAARETEQEEEEETGVISGIEAVLKMLEVASDRWSELRSSEITTEDDETRPATVLDGTLDGPSIPVAEEHQPFLNDDTNEEEHGSIMDVHANLRKKVIEVLRLEDEFVETYYRDGTVNVPL